MQKKNASPQKKQQIDWGITIFPLVAIVVLAVYLVLRPQQAEAAIGALRNLLVNDLGSIYMIFGLGYWFCHWALLFPNMAISVWARGKNPVIRPLPGAR